MRLYFSFLLLLFLACTSAGEKKVKEQEITIPVPDSSWVTHRCDTLIRGLRISTPAQATVTVTGNQINVKLDKFACLVIRSERIDMEEEKIWLEENKRKNIHYFIDTPSEMLFTCSDENAPEGFRTSNSFFASKEICGSSFSSAMDGIVNIQTSPKKVYNQPMELTTLMLGIWRTLHCDSTVKHETNF